MPRSAISAVASGNAGLAVALAVDLVALVADAAIGIAAARLADAALGVAIKTVIAAIAALAAVAAPARTRHLGTAGSH